VSITAIIKGVLAFIALVRLWLQRSHDADERQAGADAANASTRAQNDERVKEANEAEIEGDRAHKTMPGDEAFDKDFRRD
jgi:hypothetical protein